MGILKKIYPLLLSFILTGCYEDFTPDVDIKNVLCLNSLITAGEPIKVSVTHTCQYNEKADIINGELPNKVDDASVTIFVNGEKKEEDYIPLEGDRIRIEAESAKYGKASAEVVVPTNVLIESLKWDAEINYYGLTAGYEPDETYYQCRMKLSAKMTINDPADVVNYYHFSYAPFLTDKEGELLTSTESEGNGNDSADESQEERPWYVYPAYFYPGTFLYESEPIFSEHIGVLDAVSGNEAFGFTFFSDRQFSGDKYTLNLQFITAGFEILIDDIDKGEYDEKLLNCGYRLHLNTVSPSFYNWCCYEWNHDYGIIGELSEIGFSEPFWGYSNVSTGAGVVAAQSRATYEVNLRDFLKKEITDFFKSEEAVSPFKSGS